VRRIAQLDGLRALAVGLVVVNHCVSWFPGGGIGVDVFFVLSGFLITSLLVDETERYGRIGRLRFYARRGLRLYPALLAMLLVTSLLLSVGLKQVLLAGTYTSDLALAWGNESMGPYIHTWSLALEEQFYLLWPLLLPFVLRLRVRWAVGLLVSLAIASAVAAQARVGHMLTPAGDVGFGVFNPFWQAHGLLIGCALALVLRHRRDWPGVVPAAWGGLAVCIAVAIAASATVDQHWAAIWNLIAEFAAALLIAGLVVSAGSLSRVFAWTPVVWIGARSYAIYLWHLPLILYAEQHLDRPLAPIVGAAAGVVAAAISWRVVELPFLRLKDRFAPHAPDAVPAWQQGAAAPAAR